MPPLCPDRLRAQCFVGSVCLATAAMPPHRRVAGDLTLERDDFSSNCHPALGYWWSMIFSENRCPLFGIMLSESETLPWGTGSGFGGEICRPAAGSERLVGLPHAPADAIEPDFRRLIVLVDIERPSIGAGGALLVV